jgi:hypothetical protein
VRTGPPRADGTAYSYDYNNSGLRQHLSIVQRLKSISRALSVFLLFLSCHISLVSAAAPTLQRVQPLGVVPGFPTNLRCTGENLTGTLQLWSSFTAETYPDPEKEEQFEITVPRLSRPGIGAFRIVGTNGLSNAMLLLVDPLTADPATGTNRTALTAQPLKFPGAVDATCSELGSDFYRVHAQRGQLLQVEVVAQRLGSPLDPVLRILDTNRHELAAADDTPGLGYDARLEFRCPRTSDYLLEVRDTRYTGSARHRYRLRAGEPLPVPLPFLSSPGLLALHHCTSAPPALAEQEPNDGPTRVQRVTLPVAIDGRFDKPRDRDCYEFTVAKGERVRVTGRTRSLGYACDLFLQLQTTNGSPVAEANASSADDGTLTNLFKEAGTYRLVAEELTRQGGPRFQYHLMLETLPGGFSLGTAIERASVPAGDTCEIEVKAQRRDYDGPIQLALAGLDERFAATNLVIAAKTNSTKVVLTTPAGLEMGDCFDFTLRGTAEVAGRIIESGLSTMEALTNQWSDLSYPPTELDGVITLSIARGKSETTQPVKRRKKNTM